MLDKHLLTRVQNRITFLVVSPLWGLFFYFLLPNQRYSGCFPVMGVILVVSYFSINFNRSFPCHGGYSMKYIDKNTKIAVVSPLWGLFQDFILKSMTVTVVSPLWGLFLLLGSWNLLKGKLFPRYGGYSMLKLPIGKNIQSCFLVMGVIPGVIPGVILNHMTAKTIFQTVVSPLWGLFLCRFSDVLHYRSCFPVVGGLFSKLYNKINF